ncbi:MAG: DNA cytosine methyltransferase [Candidatus Riflebacteria bacterium]|nr:DNA cytosine methyltransferase [Candidatus Riflebacteria bacterium]
MIEIKDKTLRGYTFIDLFAGMGGFRLALESFGAKCVYSSEWDRHAQQTYRINFGDMPDGDITQVDEKDIPVHDILCAGFPCQAFSISGKQKGFDDSRGTLFFDVARIVKEKRPSVVFLENVKNFAAHDNGNTLEIVKNTFIELEYSFDSAVLSSLNYGIPQKRERIYMVCFSKDLKIGTFSFPEPFELNRYLEDFLLPNDEVKSLIVERDDLVLNDKASVTRNSRSTIRVGTVGKGGQGERIYSPKGIAVTLSAYGGGVFSKTGGYLIDGKTRKLHPRECARLMGFPDSYKLHPSDNQAYKQLGNSVVVDVLQLIAKQIAEVLNCCN